MESVVSTKWLNKELKNQDSNVIIFDTTWFSFKDAISEVYFQKHIVKAKYFDMTFGVKNSEKEPPTLPTPETFEVNARRLAVNNDSHIVLYDATGKCGFFVAATVWWMFKLFGHEQVSVLDGGFEKWIADGYDTTDSLSMKKEEGDFSVKSLKKTWIKTFDEMKENLTGKTFQVCDSREHEAYCKGHYPDSINFPHSSLLNEETNCLKSVYELKQLFADSDIELNKPIVTMSTHGISSCALALAAYVCGCPNVAVFHGGFVEWKMKADLTLIEVTPE